MKGRPSRYKNRTGFVSTKGESEKFVSVKGKEVIGLQECVRKYLHIIIKMEVTI